MAKKPRKRRFGWIRELPNGTFHASYPDHDKRTYVRPNGRVLTVRYNAPSTFQSKDDAETWLSDERKLIETGRWTPPPERHAARIARLPTLGEYAPRWLANRKVKGRPIADRTRDHYQDLLDRFILPRFGEVPLKNITPADVGHWYDLTAINRPTTRAHAYGLLKAILNSAADPAANGGAPLIPFNPCGIKGGGSSERAKRPTPPTAQEVARLVEAMPEKHRLMVLLADGMGLRFGELAELRRFDVDVKRQVIRVRRGVVRSTSAGVTAKTPKSEAGIRDLPIPPHLMPAIVDHLATHAAPGAQGLLFPGRGGEHLAPSAFYGKPEQKRSGKPPKKGWGWYEARRVIGRTDLHFHDLRHGALTEAARHGATMAELMRLGGHSTMDAAMRYQAAADDRLAELARKRSESLGWVGGTHD